MPINRPFKKSYPENGNFMFSRFPYCDYDAAGDEQTHRVINIMKRFSFKDTSKLVTRDFTGWIIREEDTPQVMAHKLYGSTHLDWVILMYNKMHDPEWSWPLDSTSLMDYVNMKYGVGNDTDTHHYVTRGHPKIADGNIVDSTYYPTTATIVTNFTHESNVNESKRSIQILPPEYLPAILAEFAKVF